MTNEYQPARRRAAHSQLILLATFLALALPCTARAAVAVIDSGAEWGGPAVAPAIAGALAARGVPARLMTADEAATAAAERSRGVWVAPHIGTCRATVAHAIVAHLKAGGGLLVLGEPPFETLLHQIGGQWVPRDIYLAKSLAAAPVIRCAGVMAGQVDTNSDGGRDGSTMTLAQEPLPDGTQHDVCVARIPRLRSWCNFGTSVSLAAGRGTSTCFWARGTTATSQLALEYKERDGSRWIAKIDLRPRWQYYVVPAAQFRYWYACNVAGRGGANDGVRLDQVDYFCAGLAHTHTRVGQGPHEFAFADVGLAPEDSMKDPALAELPEIDGLYPKKKLYPVKPDICRVAEPFRDVVGTGGGTEFALPLVRSAWSSAWRPMGSGIEARRDRRFIPVVTALNANGTRAGTVAAITLAFTDYPDAVYGYVGVMDDDSLMTDPWLHLVAGMARRMDWRIFLREAGSNQFTYDVRDLQTTGIRLAAETIQNAIPAAQKKTLKLDLAVTAGERKVWGTEREVGYGQALRVPHTIPYDDPLSGGLVLTARLLWGTRLFDTIRQEIHFDGPRTGQRYTEARDGTFVRDGRPWRMFGVNYMPSSGVGRMDTEGHQFELWLNDWSYDPEIVDADLARIASLGMNMVSAFIYNAPPEQANLLDFLRLCRRHGLLVNLSLRPNFNPMPAADDVLTSIVTQFRTAEKDEIVAYDVAWEPWWGDAQRRRTHGGEWKRWVVDRYGSVEKAEKAWGWKLGRQPVEEFPDAAQLDEEGPYLKAVNDYRVFVDETLGAAYGRARATLERLAPRQLVSFRQSEGANPKVDPHAFAMDLRSVCDAVDFYSPEAYGLGGSDETARLMIFAASYAQGLTPGKPVIWAEYGMSVWSGNPFEPQPELLEIQADVIERILRNAQESRAAGTVAWWYPGGYRMGEDSDYGILNPDGTARPATRVLRKYAEAAKAPPPPVEWKPEIRSLREESVRGYTGIYERVGKRFFREMTSQTIPLLTTR